MPEEATSSAPWITPHETQPIPGRAHAASPITWIAPTGEQVLVKLVRDEERSSRIFPPPQPWLDEPGVGLRIFIWNEGAKLVDAARHLGSVNGDLEGVDAATVSRFDRSFHATRDELVDCRIPLRLREFRLRRWSIRRLYRCGRCRRCGDDAAR